jgi:hypothetical protein
MTEDGWDPESHRIDPEATEAEDQVYLDNMTRSRVYIAVGFLVIGFLIVWPLIPGASWMNHHAFAPVVTWWRTQPGRLTYQYGSGLVVAIVMALSLRHGWRVAALRGFLLMAGFFILALVLFHP